MKILVTGKNGQVARALAFVNRKHDLVFAGRPELDLEQPGALRDAVLDIRPDVILSCAAFTQVDACESEPERALAVNGDAPAQLAEAAEALSIPIIHLSTDYVFDGALQRPYREDDTPRPLSVYGRSKLAGERSVVANCRRGFVVRVSWVYSQFSNNFLSSMLKLAETRNEISVVDDQVSCPTPAIELAEALLNLAETVTGAGAWGGIYHLAGQEAVDRATLAEAVMRWAADRGRPTARIQRIPTSTFPTPAERPLYSALDCQKINATYDIVLPAWRDWLPPCLDAIVGKGRDI